MRTERISFENKRGVSLSARLELPVGSLPTRFAIFAHCFTCGMQIKAATVISRQLTQSGFGVLRFDFTGLGKSEGDFAETGFTTNIDDIIAAGEYLKTDYHAASLLIGHSLGGTAVIHAAAKMPEIKAVCSIGAPFEAAHVMQLFTSGKEEIANRGKATVSIGGKPFEIGLSFIKDIETHSTREILSKFKKPILVMHSPQDKIVEIQNAAEIYGAAFHPKSFISLDGADHLLNNSQDATYAATVLSAWSARYVPELKVDLLTTEEHVAVQLGNDGFTTEVVAAEHRFLADEPLDLGGNNMGPSPYQLLNAALGTCTAMTLKMYADRKNWELQKVTVHLSHHKKHAEDSAHPETAKSKIEHFSRIVEVEGNLDEEQKQKLLEIANKCPVHRTLTESDVVIETKLNTIS